MSDINIINNNVNNNNNSTYPGFGVPWWYVRLYLVAALIVFISFMVFMYPKAFLGMGIIIGFFMVIVGIVGGTVRYFQRRNEQRIALAKRADEENSLYRKGDTRGVYGTYPPFSVN